MDVTLESAIDNKSIATIYMVHYSFAFYKIYLVVNSDGSMSSGIRIQEHEKKICKNVDATLIHFSIHIVEQSIS